jgi:hypothetical protein
VKESEGFSVEAFPILGEPAAAIEPRDGAFDNPPFGQHDKAFGVVGSLDDFGFELRKNSRQRLLKFRTLIACIGQNLFQKRKKTCKLFDQKGAAVTILNIRRMHDGLKQQAAYVYKNVPLLAFDFLARVITVRIVGPPFSALFTLWLSMMPRVGLASLFSRSRHLT